MLTSPCVSPLCVPLSVFFLTGVTDGHSGSCVTFYWLVSCGFSMLFGSLIVKNYRLLAIFTSRVFKVTVIRDHGGCGENTRAACLSLLSAPCVSLLSAPFNVWFC